MCSSAVHLIIQATERAGIARIVVLGSAGALDFALDKQPAWRRWLVENLVYKTALKWPVASQRAQYTALSASPLDWTMVMPPLLTNRPPRGSYRIDGDALPRNGSSISRADVAYFMLQQLTTPAWSRRGVYITW
jgi:putative NADH-flavin reductase